MTRSPKNQSRMPCARLDRFICRKVEELSRLLARDDDRESPLQRPRQHTEKITRLRRIILEAKAEVMHAEAKLSERADIQNRLSHLEEKYRARREQLESLITTSSTYTSSACRELHAEIERLTQRIQVLGHKLIERATDKEPQSEK